MDVPMVRTACSWAVLSTRLVAHLISVSGALFGGVGVVGHGRRGARYDPAGRTRQGPDIVELVVLSIGSVAVTGRRHRRPHHAHNRKPLAPPTT